MFWAKKYQAKKRDWAFAIHVKYQIYLLQIKYDE